MKYFYKAAIILIFLTSCGYQPILSNKVNNLSFEDLNASGNKKISLRILNNLNISKDIDVKTSLDVLSKYQRVISSKNKKGNPEIFNIILDVKISVKSNGTLVDEKNFYESVNFNNEKNKFNLKKKENNLKSNLINKVSQDIRKYLLTLNYNDN